MEDSIPRPEPPAWLNLLNGASAAALALIFLVAGIWKVTDPVQAATLMTQALVPGPLSMPLALLLGGSETVAGVLLLVPRFRRWGAWLAGGLLLVFLIYFAINYAELHGKECSCFPWIKRTVGPGFFLGDALMLTLALLAWRWAQPAGDRRGAALVSAAVAVFTMVSYGVSATRQTGAEAPASITVEGKPYALDSGRVLVYFFDPECSHCFQAAQQMAGFQWKRTRLVVVPTRLQQFAGQFLENTGLKAAVSLDHELLRKRFPFVNAPYAVALENGRQKAVFRYFEEKEPRATLARLGYID